jgi:hypothetical protein
VVDDSKAGFAPGINRAMVVVSLAVGSAFLLVGGYWVHRMHLDQFIFNHATAQGQVVENRRNPVGRTSYRAMVRFSPRGGGDVTVADWIALNPASFGVGQSVTLFYDPEDPQSAMIDRGWKNYLAPGIPGVMGFLMILGGVQRLRRILVEKGNDAFTGNTE